MTYDQIRYRLKLAYFQYYPNAIDPPFALPLVAGGLARTLAVTAANPLELIRTKMQSQRLSYLRE